MKILKFDLKQEINITMRLEYLAQNYLCQMLTEREEVLDSESV